MALAAARQGIVLLQNGVAGAAAKLPLSKSSAKRIAMVGPNANASMNLLSGYHGSAPFLVSPLQAMRKKWGAANVAYSVGCNVSDVDNKGNVTPPAIVKAAIAAAVARPAASTIQKGTRVLISLWYSLLYLVPARTLANPIAR